MLSYPIHLLLWSFLYKFTPGRTTYRDVNFSVPNKGHYSNCYRYARAPVFLKNVLHVLSLVFPGDGLFSLSFDKIKLNF